MANTPPPNKSASRVPRRAGPAWFAWLGVVVVLIGLAAVLHRGGDSDYTQGSTSTTARPLAASGYSNLSVRGAGSFSLAVEDDGSARSVQWNGTTYTDGAQIGAVSVRDKDDGFVLTARSGTTLRFKAKDDSGYSIRNESGDVLYRVKVKDDKFNVYDSTGKRLLYGKEKKGELRLRDDSGTEIGAINGTTQLAYAAILAVPIEPEMRIAAFVHRAEQLVP